MAPVLAFPTPARAEDVYRGRLVVGNLENAAAFTFAPDGRIFIAERLTGDIVVYNPRRDRIRRFATVSRLVGSVGNELGLVGIAVHPSFPDRPYVYAYATRDVSGTARIQIIRYRASRGGRGEAVDPTVIYQSATPAGELHVGGRMLFGPDGLLYVFVGDAGSPANAQNLDVERGKLLRMTPKAAPVPENPFGTRVYSYGHRNSFGFDFDPATGRIWQTENGPECNDEVNRIVERGNFAWGPHETCATPPRAPANTNQDGPDPRRLPEVYYADTLGLTGLVFCRRCGLGPAAEGAFFFGAFNTGTITRATLDERRRHVASRRVVLTHEPRVLSMETSPKGRLFFSDGRGIYRIESLRR